MLIPFQLTPSHVTLYGYGAKQLIHVGFEFGGTVHAFLL